MKLNILTFFLLLFTLFSFGQKLEYSTLLIPDSLKQNANAVVRLSKLEINVASQKEMLLKSTEVTTVLNEFGLRNLNLVKHYDKNTRINKIEATAYDAFGRELKSYKRKDFKDQSAVQGITLFSDSRLLYLDYTPISYPFTIVFETEIETSNTAFIPSWSPMEGYLVSTETAALTINFKKELNIRKKEANFSGQYKIEMKETETSVSYSAKNLIARKREELSPDYFEIFPIVYFALENFALENVSGKAVNWSEFGKWYYHSLLADTEEIPQETKIKIRQLVGNEKDPIAIAKIVYKYVQEKTRYVLIYVGIGGWKPMLAKEVDKLGYGDCKALTNYTRCLLKEVGVTSYYTIVESGSERPKDLQSDFASVDGNHIILALPDKDEMIWLECTSQIQPFGFQGHFTDDRNVLVVKPEGGEIIKTKTYSEAENLKLIDGSYKISAEGNFSGKVKLTSKGLQYESVFGKERISREDQIKYHSEEFDNINNLKFTKINYRNNPEIIEFVEELELEAEGYAQNSGGKLLFALNAFNQSANVPKKYKNRELPFEMGRGFTEEAKIEITIPDGFMVEAKPNGLEQDTEFGYYKIEFDTVSPSKIICKRRLIVKKGLYDKSKYESYRKFIETIAKTDNSKIVIAKV